MDLTAITLQIISKRFHDALHVNYAFFLDNVFKAHREWALILFLMQCVMIPWTLINNMFFCEYMTVLYLCKILN